MLAELIDAPSVAIAEIARHLDGLTEGQRLAEVGALGRGRQRALYEKAAAAAPIDTCAETRRMKSRVRW